MQAQEDVLGIARPDVDVRHPQRIEPGQIVDVVRRVREVRYRVERLVGGAQRFVHVRPTLAVLALMQPDLIAMTGAFAAAPRRARGKSRGRRRQERGASTNEGTAEC